ncbi:IS256 family transposase [Fervidobacterium thailandense]|uniref:IS256 family transposase n=1 Tax=Fervidobacterium thailandense TaxID=1008305 RepID=UPI000B2F59D4|nr:transposase [Fervidobacterium thailandense]
MLSHSKKNLCFSKLVKLPEQVLALFIDAYHCFVRSDSRVSEHACYIIVGIDLKGQKDIFGVYTFPGNESSLNWNVVLRDLFDRGLKEPCIIVSDDFPGLHDKLKMVYPKAHHQLCLVHLQRNIRKNLPKQDASQLNEQVKQLIHFDDVHTGKVHLERLFSQYMNNPKYSSYIKTLFEKIEQYTAFLNFPKPVRKHLYTTNVVESVNSLVEKIRISQGGYFNSIEVLELNIYLRRQNLKQTKWKNSVPRIAGEAYEVLQIYNVMYKLSR